MCCSIVLFSLQTPVLHDCSRVEALVSGGSFRLDAAGLPLWRQTWAAAAAGCEPLVACAIQSEIVSECESQGMLCTLFHTNNFRMDAHKEGRRRGAIFPFGTHGTESESCTPALAMPGGAEPRVNYFWGDPSRRLLTCCVRAREVVGVWVVSVS